MASTTTKRIVAFARNNPSKPLRIGAIEGIRTRQRAVDEHNRLITAGMIDNEPACGGAPRTKKASVVREGGTLPIFIAVAFMQRYMVRGISLGAVKG